MRTRIAAIAVAAGVLAFGFGPSADAAPSSHRRLLCGGVKSVDVGFCVDNPLPWSVSLPRQP